MNHAQSGRSGPRHTRQQSRYKARKIRQRELKACKGADKQDADAKTKHQARTSMRGAGARRALLQRCFVTFLCKIRDLNLPTARGNGRHTLPQLRPSTLQNITPPMIPYIIHRHP
eukprot:353880-Chlamydomonas_euryale.AAC.24